MPVSPGTRLGPFEVLSALGAGGMGEVYRARDTKLGRDVAIKVLPESFAGDPDRLSRFQREARVLASLNHPHIGGIYGLEDVDGVHALVLELVDGETLSDRIRRGPLAVAEALAVARQITDALDAAHERGIIHRDIKPGNIGLTRDSVVKVLDFGLASDRNASSADLTQSPTVTVHGTRDGVLLGTAAYMSPEQARGGAVDRRTDVWAFGCVLYEMLTGRALFGRSTISDTIAAVIEREPDWKALPPSVPEPVVRLLRRCLQKDARQRFRDIGDVRIAIDEALAPQADDDGTVGDRPRARGAAPWMFAAAVLVALGSTAALLWTLSNRRDGSAATVTRTTVMLPTNAELDAGQTAAPLAISPDGRRLAFVARGEGRTRIYIRPLDTFRATPIEGTDGAQYPFFSPDGESVAFFADDKLKRVSIAGGAPVPICDAPRFGRGGTWGADGTIVFAQVTSGLMMVPAAGGKAEPITSRDATMDAQTYTWPEFLPDDQHLLATLTRWQTGDPETLAVFSRKDREWRALGPGSQAEYLSPGYLVYHDVKAREGQLSAARFDAASATIQGTPVSVLDGVFRAANAGAAFFAVAPTGALVFAPGGFARGLVFVDRHGRRTPLTRERQGFRFPRLSPDGHTVAVTIDPRPSQIFVYDVERGSRLQLSSSRNHSILPVWTNDGQRVAYGGPLGILWRPADGSQAEETFLRVDGSGADPTDWSADGLSLIFQVSDPVTNYDIWVAPQGEKPRPLIATPSREVGGRLSLDGRWLAYYSNESGRNEVYVRPFPNVNEERWTISTAGGWSPVWSHDGHELFYMNAAAVMAVPVQTRGPRFVAGAPEYLFDGPFDTTQDMNFDISPDGTRFVMVEADPDASPTRLQVVLNWVEELKTKLPAK